MHTSVKMETPCELINITKINPLISKCQIKVCYVGEDPNRNGSIITKEVAREMANTLPGSPVVGYYNEDKKDFEGHNRNIEISGGKFIVKDTTKPYGFVDLNAKCWFQKFLDDGKDEREYLCTEGYLWTGQYPEVQRCIEHGNNQSMELDENNLDAHWSKDDSGKPQFFIINEAVISKLCILGEDTEPCFEGASVTDIKFSFEEGFQEKLFSMMNELKELLQEGGTETMPENENVVLEEEQNFASKEEDKKKKKAEEAPAEDSKKDEAPEDNSSDKKEEPTDTSKSDDSKKEEKDASSEEKKDDEEDPKKKDKKKQYDLNEIPEYVELKNSYESLQEEVETLKQAKAALESELAPLKEFKANAEKEKKQEMIDSFYMLNDEDKKDVVDNIDTYSLDDIEAKLSIICVRNKVSFDNLDNENREKAPTTYNLGSFDDDESMPAWVKSALSVAKELEN